MGSDLTSETSHVEDRGLQKGDVTRVRFLFHRWYFCPLLVVVAVVVLFPISSLLFNPAGVLLFYSIYSILSLSSRAQVAFSRAQEALSSKVDHDIRRRRLLVPFYLAGLLSLVIVARRLTSIPVKAPRA